MVSGGSSALEIVWTGCVGTVQLLVGLARALLLSLLAQNKERKKRRQVKYGGKDKKRERTTALLERNSSSMSHLINITCFC